MQTVSSAIAWWAKATPDTVAISVDGDRIAYRDYWPWIERVAAQLIADGLEIGDRVGICAANSAAYCVLMMGVIRAGGIVSPLNARYTPSEIGEILEDTTPRFVYADAERRAKFDGLGIAPRPIEALAELRSGAPAAVTRELDPDLPIVIISTSGSTAKPKGVVYSHRTMTGYAAEFAIMEPECRPGSRLISPAPLSTSAGFVQLSHYTTIGCSVFMESVFDPARYLRMLVDDRINMFGAAPVFFERIAACPEFATADLSAIRIATTGGARVSRPLQDAWLAKGVVLRQIYGQTEAGGNSTMMPAALAPTFPEKCGRGGIFTEMAIVDDSGCRLPPGEQGQIIIRGPGVMLGYWRNPEATAATLRDGWLYTGDIGVIDEDGYLTFIDRMKDIIISGGLNISAAEVERAISEVAGVEEVVVIAASDPKFGETPMAVVYASREIAPGDLIAHCNGRLADYKVPRYVAFESEPLPRLATGKLSKPALRQKYKDAAQTLARVR